MSDLARAPSLTPGLSLSAAPPPAFAPMRFSLDGVPEKDRTAVYREIFGREVLKYDLEPLPDIPLDVDLKFQVLPGLMMMSGRVHGSRNTRTRATLAAEGSEDMALLVNLRGAHRVTHGQQELVLGDGEATLMSTAETCSFTHLPPGVVIALRVPRQRFAPLVTKVDDSYMRRIPNSTPALKLLVDYVKVAQDSDGLAGPVLQHLFVNHVHDLMSVAVGATRDGAELAKSGGLRAAKLHAIKLDIAQNLDQPDLSVATLAFRQSCTPRFVQRLFEMEGITFTEYVLEQRLARAHRVLSDPRREGDKISGVAWDSGFGDVSYFNRAFRRRYGLAPSDVRAQGRQGALA